MRHSAENAILAFLEQTVESMTTDFEFIVIGNGLFGSAAARYLGKQCQAVAIIGPAEPENERTHDGVFASHYDERRLVRVLGHSRVRSKLGQMSMGNYRALEKQSGITFYEPVGYLIVNSETIEDNNLESPLEMARDLDVPHTLYKEGDRSWQKQHPHFSFPTTHWIIHEPAPAGMINPRAMLSAQNAIAEQQGSIIIPELVARVEEKSDFVKIETQSGKHYTARKVLVTVGAFTNCFEFFPKKLPLQAETETFILAQVSTGEANRLKGLPALAYTINDPVIRDIYMAPPVRYADGNFYIKMGANTPSDVQPNSLAEIQDWFHKGESDSHLADFERVLRKILPDVDFLSFESKRCIITRTATKYPIIDQITARSFVTSGGNGSGAVTADSIGRLAASLLMKEPWILQIPRNLFHATEYD